MNFDPNIINSISESIPNTTKEALLNPTAINIGKSVGGISRLFLMPFLKMNIITQKNLEDFEKEIYKKSDDIPIENRDKSKLGLALKAIEDSKYQLDSEDLRQLFVNLISSTIDNRKNNNCHPRFSTILSEMDNNDAIFLNRLIEIQSSFDGQEFIPTCQIERHNKESGGHSDIGELFILTGSAPISNNAALNNLQSLGIIEVNTELKPTSDFYLDKFQSFEEFINVKKIEDKLPSGYSIFLLNGHIKFTELGKNLITIVS